MQNIKKSARQHPAKPIPNQRLLHERVRRGWSQQEVADRTGTTPLSISRWERGITVPRAHFCYQLTLLFEKCAEELSLRQTPIDYSNKLIDQHEAAMQKITAAPVVVPHCWYVPHRRDPFFTRRESILATLYTAFHGHKLGTLIPIQADAVQKPYQPRARVCTLQHIPCSSSARPSWFMRRVQ